MFIGRLPDGSIYGAWTSPQPPDQFHTGIEELPDNHPDVLAFTTRPMPVGVDPLSAALADISGLKQRMTVVEVGSK